jgi:hypothetical protein
MNFHKRGTEEAAFERESCARLRREVGEESAQKLACKLHERAVYQQYFLFLFSQKDRPLILLLAQNKKGITSTV